MKDFVVQRIELGKTPIIFVIDADGDLEISTTAWEAGEIDRWLTRDDGEKLYAFLGEWLGKSRSE